MTIPIVTCDHNQVPHPLDQFCRNPVGRLGHQATHLQPAPETGEWRVECQLVKVAEPPRGRVVIKDVTTLRIIACEDNPARWDQALTDFEQIVADHNAVPRLVEALEDIRQRAEFALTTPGFVRGRDELQKAVNVAVLALTTLRRSG